MFENNPLVVIIAFIVVLTPLILIHELGHFLAAKAVGITILEFGLGFPPKVKKLFTWRGTEFTLNWIPLGGFVRPLGEDVIRPLGDESVEQDRQEFLREQANTNTGHTTAKSVNEASPLARIVFMAAGAFANFLLAFILFVIVALLGIQDIVGSSLQVVNINPDSALAQAGVQQNDIITDVNGQKFVTVEELFAKLSDTSSESTQLRVLRGDNQQVDVTVALPLQSTQSVTHTQIRDISPSSPASEAGIQANDLVIAFNEVTINGVEDFRTKIRENLGKEVLITLERDGSQFDVRLTPRVDPPQGQGAVGVVVGELLTNSGLGLNFAPLPQIDYVPQSFANAVRYGYENVVAVISSVVELPSRLMAGSISAEEARPVSVLGISQIGAVFIEQSISQQRITPILLFIATISVGLGFFNLLPIPALDGGRILFVLIEIVRGKPISPEREGLVHLIGLALLLSLSVLVLLNDVINPVTNQLR
ncbi:MAG: RIP metalloprotease RseP [Chloroflexi bacterium]|nr:RIP metalloprotease RseP [Chloroflexota bacterium]MCC6891322.1 RIP metalloprotease RseP [Anaerolineae bacterium]